MKRGFVGVLLACVALFLAACSSSGGKTGNGGASGGDAYDPDATFRYVTSSGPSSFDPHKTRVLADSIYLHLVYDRLVHPDADGNPTPGLAEKWEISTDAKKIVFHLRDANFADGSPIDGDAIVSNLRRAMDPESTTAKMIASIDQVSAPDAKTVEVAMSRPDVSVLMSLSDLPGMIVNPKAFSDAKKLALEPQSSGRFTLLAAEVGAKYTFGARDDYWDKDSLKVKRLEWHVVTSEQTRINGLRAGQFDCLKATPTMIAQFKKDPEYVTKARPVLTNNVLYFNHANGVLAKKAARQAVSIAVDRQAIVDAALEGEGSPTNQMFPEGYLAHSKEIEVPKRDLGKVRGLLAEAGVPNGFSFTAIVLNIPQYATTAQIIQSNLAEVGIEMKLVTMGVADASPAFIRGEGDAIVTAFLGRADPSTLLASYFLEDSPENPSHLSIPGFAAALERANAIGEPAARARAFDETNRIIADYVPIVPLSFNMVGAICSKSVLGYEAPILYDELRGIAMKR